MGIGGGLDFWSPNLNIFRDPRWGRGQETYGEDPFLTGRMGVAFVTGMQGDDPNYYRAIATPKHYAVHSGPEPTRHFADVDVSKHDEVDTYEPAFRAAIVEGKAGSVMCAYNAINGEPACANQYPDAVISCATSGASRATWSPTATPFATLPATIAIVQPRPRVWPSPLSAAWTTSASPSQQGMANQSTKPTSTPCSRVTCLRAPSTHPSSASSSPASSLGMFDPPDMDPYSKIDPKELDSAEHRAFALKLSNESMVLLKNDGMLPLKSGIKKIAVVGPLADQTRPLIGNYAGQPTHIVSVMEGLKAEFPNATITYVPGTQFLRADGTPVPDSVLSTPDGKPGLKADYGEGFMRGRPIPGGNAAPIVSRTEPNVNLNDSTVPTEIAGKKTFGVQWSGFLTPTESGDFLVGVRSDGFARLTVDDKQTAMAGRGNGIDSSVGRVTLEKGHKVAISLTYGSMNGKPHAELIWAKVNSAPSPEAIAAAKNADAVIAVVGITSSLEGEEMPVSEPGFLGGDRTSIDLPAPEEALVEAVQATGKPLAVVLMNGSALAVNWINGHANAVLEAWYPGEEGGAAIAETLSGKNNPAGRLPVTFYTGVNQLPNFEDYQMAGPHLPVLQRQAALSVWLRPQLHHLQLQRPQRS